MALGGWSLLRLVGGQPLIIGAPVHWGQMGVENPQTTQWPLFTISFCLLSQPHFCRPGRQVQREAVWVGSQLLLPCAYSASQGYGPGWVPP